MKPQKHVISFLKEQAGRQQKTLFLWSPVFIGIGILFYFQGVGDTSWDKMSGALFFLALALWKSFHTYRKTARPAYGLCLLVCLAVGLIWIGFAAAKIRTDNLTIPLIEKDLPPQEITGTIEKLVMLDGGKAKRVILNNVTPERPRDNSQPYRVRLKTYHFKGEDWQIGDQVSVRAKLLAPSPPVIPGGFDFSFKAKYEGISAVGYTMADAVLLDRRGADGKSDFIQGLRDYIAERLYAAMDPRYAGIAQALLVGERVGIANEDTEALRVSGLAHLLAISGLHIGLAAGCIFFFVRLALALIPGFALKYPIKKYAAACAILIAFCYMILAGATLPTIRAFIMSSLVLLAVILDRSALNMRLVALAAIVVMLTSPEAIMGPSFILSFAAVAGLIAFYQAVGRHWLLQAQSRNPILKPVYYVTGIIATTLVATFATAPFSVMFFNRFAIYSVIANMFAMPLMAFAVMPFGLLASLSIPLSLDVYLWPVVEEGIKAITDVAHYVADYDGASLWLPGFGTGATALIGIGFLWLVLWQGWLRLVGIPLIMLAFILPHVNQPAKSILISEDMKAILVVDHASDGLFLIGKMNSYLKSNWLGTLGIDPESNIPRFDRGGSADFMACDDMMCRVTKDMSFLRKQESHSLNEKEIPAFAGMTPHSPRKRGTEMTKTNIAIILNPLALPQACESSDLIISLIPVKDWQDCPKPQVIDRFNMLDYGATLVMIESKAITIKTVK